MCNETAKKCHIHLKDMEAGWYRRLSRFQQVKLNPQGSLLWYFAQKDLLLH
jgi:hypothetical protein